MGKLMSYIYSKIKMKLLDEKYDKIYAANLSFQKCFNIPLAVIIVSFNFVQITNELCVLLILYRRGHKIQSIIEMIIQVFRFLLRTIYMAVIFDKFGKQTSKYIHLL